MFYMKYISNVKFIFQKIQKESDVKKHNIFFSAFHFMYKFCGDDNEW